MSNKAYKIIIAFVLLFMFIVIGSFLFGRKTVSSVVKDQQVVEKFVAQKKSSYPIRIMFVGDMMFDRYIRQVSERRGGAYPFQKVESILRDNDLVIGNLEGPITDQSSVSVASIIGEKNNYIFTFDSKIPNLLSRENIRLVNIGNNHILNFGISGVESTRKYLTDSAVEYFGDPENAESRIKIENIKGLRIAFVNYNQFVSDAKQKTLDDIMKAKNSKVDFIMLYTHWGTEFVPDPSGKIKELAHEFIDNGVDVIIGSHPHVVQTIEEYKGRKIYYSLGNFIFDQYFRPETKKGLAVQIEIGSDGKMLFRDYSIKMDGNGQTSQ